MRTRLTVFFSFFLLAVLYSVNVLSTTDAAYTVIEDQATLPILTPPLMERKTAKIRLNNGLEAYIISDPGVDKSAAALSVNVGSWSDPDAYPGLAHFVEHMLFLGTSKYPNESEYHRFVKENGGISNAYTSHDHTAFAFSINHRGFVEALDRFSWFFKDPLFNPSGVDRELSAVDQEFSMHLNSDSRREYYILKELSNPAHPHHRFATGSLSTLSDVSQEMLKEWAFQHYSANLMHLVVVSPMPLDDLTAIVVEDFHDITDNAKEAFSTTVPVISPDLMGKMITIAPLKDKRSLSLMWELPAPFAQQLEKCPDSLIAFVLGHEGEESLLALLKRENLAEALSAGGQHLSDNSLFFCIDVQLTEQGLKQIDTVIERVFQGIALLKRRNIPEHIFREEERMQKIQYQYQSRDDAYDTVISHARAMLYENLETYPEHTAVIQAFDNDLIARFISMLTPARCIYTLVAPPSTAKASLDRTERWLKASYTVKPIPSAKIKAWSKVERHPHIALPPTNHLVPKNLTLVTRTVKETKPQELIVHPELIIDDVKNGRIFFASDTRYRVPEVQWLFKIKTPMIDRNDAATLVLADLYVRSISELLNTFSYKAALAGLHFNIGRVNDGIAISVKGYSENAPILLEKIFEMLKMGRPSEDKFIIYRKSLQRSYENFRKEPPLSQGTELLKMVLYRDFVTERQKAQAIKMVGYKDLLDFADSIFNKCYLESVLYGNMTKENAEQVWKQYRRIIKGKGYPRDRHYHRQVVVLPKNGPFYLERSVVQSGNAVILAVQNGPYAFKERAAQQILGKSLEEPFFSELRTKQQTGYVVYNTTQEIERQLFSFFAVQSGSHNNRDLLARFEQFVEEFLQEIDKGPEAQERFETIKEALITTLKRPPNNIEEMGDILQMLAFEYDADFDFLNQRIKGFEDLTFEEFVALAQQFLGRSNKQRLAIFIKGKIPEDVVLDYKKMNSASALRSRSRYVNKYSLS